MTQGPGAASQCSVGKAALQFQVHTSTKRGEPKTRKCHKSVTQSLVRANMPLRPTVSALYAVTPGPSPITSSSALQIPLPTVCPLRGYYASAADSTTERTSPFQSPFNVVF
jgi:hypothetical protein